MNTRRERILIGVTALAWGLALIGYFGPWIGHRAASLAWNAYDLFDLLRLLPDVASGAVTVNLQALRLPLVGLAVLLPLLAARAPLPWRVAASVVGAVLALATLPSYPEILGAWSKPGWRVPFWWGIGGIVTAFSLLFVSRLGLYRPWLGLSWTLLTGIPSIVTFRRLVPALSVLHARPVAPGWGMWLCALGMSGIALGLWVEGLTSSFSEERSAAMKSEIMSALQSAKARYKSKLLKKANVVGVGVGMRMREGEPTGEPAIIVNVTHKMPLEDLPPEDRIPQEIDGVPVDVQPIGKIIAH